MEEVLLFAEANALDERSAMRKIESFQGFGSVDVGALGQVGRNGREYQADSRGRIVQIETNLLRSFVASRVQLRHA